MAQIESIKQVELFPTNRANAANTWSYRNGNPTLCYSINQQDAYLMSRSLRLNFKLRLRTSADAFPNNNDAAGGGAVEVRQDAKVGALSVFQSINVSNSLNQSLERVQNAPRLAATLIPSGANFSSYANELQLETGGTSSDDAQGRRQNAEMEVCCRVMAGMFLMNAEIPLGEAGKGCLGINLKFNLAPSIEANYGAQGSGSWYEVINPSLTFTLGMPPGGQLPSISALPYTSFSSYYAVLSNGDETQSINCGLGSVVSCFSNFVPTTYIANSTQNGNDSYTLRNAPYTDDTQYAPVSRYTTLRGGLKYPYQFSVDENELITQSGVDYTARYTAQREKNFLSALQPSKDRTSTLAGNISESGLGVSPTSTADADRYNTLSSHVYGLGARFDGLGNGAGASFKQAQFSHRIQSKLDGVSPNSIYTFFLHRNLISFAGGGISVAN